MKVSLNPLSLASATLLLIAPFASWATLSSFGFIIPSSLWDIASNRTPYPISPTLATSALLTGLLLTVSGAVSLRRTKPSLVLSILGVIMFSVESYSLYGTFGEGILATILPGSGFLIATSGIILGIASLRTVRLPFFTLARQVRTPRGLASFGVILSALTLGVDAWDHWSEGHFSAILGTPGVEMIIHSVFLLGIPAILVAFLAIPRLFWGKIGLGLTVVAFSGLVLDGFYHAATGSVVEVVGSGSTEIFLHALTYYGVASAVLARMFPETNGVSKEAKALPEKADEIPISM